ncbi:MAG TPA: hypothetical protein VJ884_02065 [Salinibacter sp.]|nr:hypothetical protein [Salinibacter sp.]
MLNNCDIRVELDENDRTYQAGDTVTGTVHVEVNNDCQCDDLILALEWHTHGRGNTVEHRVGQQSLFRGEWAAGEHHQYDVEMELPPGPYTYHGEYLNVDWRLTAEADIPWAMDPSAEQELLLEPSGTEDHFQAGDEDVVERASASGDDDQAISWGGVVFGIIFLGMGLPFLYYSLSSMQMMMGLFSAPFVAVGGFLVYRSVRNALAERRLGSVNVQLDPAETHPGERMRCRVSMEPPSTVDLNEITVRLHGYERVVSGHGTNKTTYTHTVHDETTSIRASQQATIHGAFRTFEAETSLPDSAPFSFHADDNELKWEVEIHVDVPNWPDWSHTEPLTVRPKTR